MIFYLVRLNSSDKIVVILVSTENSYKCSFEIGLKFWHPAKTVSKQNAGNIFMTISLLGNFYNHLLNQILGLVKTPNFTVR